VLIANDESMQLFILMTMFKNFNDLEVITVVNGHEAFELIQESLREFANSDLDLTLLFDMVLLDLNMPISNGFEACKNICRIYS
jgi:CheY-like chemotaxis protein